MRYIDFSSVKETIGKIYFGICICVFAYAVIGVPILLGMLKKHGVKTEAVIHLILRLGSIAILRIVICMSFKSEIKLMMEIRLWRKVIIARLAPGYKCYTWIGILLSTDLRIIGMINRFLRIASPQGSNKHNYGRKDKAKR